MKKSLVLMLVVFIFTITKSYAAAAVAEIKATSEGSLVSGQVTFEEIAEGLKVTAEISNVSPGKHGFHIHENGACEDMGKAAGGHFNPDGMSHGLLSKDGLGHAHAGDLGNIDVAQDGTGKLEAVLAGLSLSGGKYDVAGKAVILHEKEDDFGQPVGNAGGRIGCGVIEIKKQ